MRLALWPHRDDHHTPLNEPELLRSASSEDWDRIHRATRVRCRRHALYLGLMLPVTLPFVALAGVSLTIELRFFLSEHIWFWCMSVVTVALGITVASLVIAAVIGALRSPPMLLVGTVGTKRKQREYGTRLGFLAVFGIIPGDSVEIRNQSAWTLRDRLREDVSDRRKAKGGISCRHRLLNPLQEREPVVLVCCDDIAVARLRDVWNGSSPRPSRTRLSLRGPGLPRQWRAHSRASFRKL
jgi:hypothetical protein